eukprot:6224997-Alexandrium_andersonii.AAC.1
MHCLPNRLVRAAPKKPLVSRHQTTSSRPPKRLKTALARGRSRQFQVLFGKMKTLESADQHWTCLLYTSPSPRD